MIYKNAAKKFAPMPPDGGQAGRDLPVRGRGRAGGYAINPIFLRMRRPSA